LEAPILICFAKQRGWRAAFSRWLMKSKFNFVFILFLDPLWNSWQTVDISQETVQILPAQISLDRVESVECLKYGHRSLIHGLQAACAMIGTSCSYWGYVSDLFRLASWRFLGLGWHSRLNDLSKYLCVDFAVGFLQLSGISSALQLDPSVMSPGDLRAFLSNNGGFEVVRLPAGFRDDT
jgi:hypothetical protein